MRKRQKLLNIIVYPYILVIVSTVLILGYFFIKSFDQFLETNTRQELAVRAMLFDKSASFRYSISNADSFQALCETLGRLTSTRFTVILPDGVVIGDTDKKYSLLDNHGDRPEILTAISGSIGLSIRYSYSIGRSFTYVAIPVVNKGEVQAVIRASIPQSTTENIIHSIYTRFSTVVLIFLIVSLIAGYVLTHWINYRLNEIIIGVKEFKNGNLSYRIPGSKSIEFGNVSESLNTMAAQLNDNFRAVSERRENLEAIFAGMTEAVFAVDTGSKIIEYNHAAEVLFNVSFEGVKGRYIHEAVLNANLLRFIKKALNGINFIEEELVINIGQEDKTLQAHGTRIISPEGIVRGAVIVLSDISRIKKLETIRRDFVANVSHELKTPITSIIGFVETLRDGAIEDVENRNQFLNIINNHAERLNGIIDDLLSLSKIEQDWEKGRIVLEICNLNLLITNAVSICEQKANERNIKISYHCPDILLKCNPNLLEQAVINLIDNSIKYSDPGSSVNIEANKIDNSVFIKVKDNGWGIPREHHERIFERFYRVDKSRSRDLGGTGLGLAIVKHIAISHGGRVEVESSPGNGSTFSIIIPV